MPIFYFDVVDGTFHHDTDGSDLPDSSHIERELKRRLSDLVLQGESPLHIVVNVRDERKDVVATASISTEISYPATHH